MTCDTGYLHTLCLAFKWFKLYEHVFQADRKNGDKETRKKGIKKVTSFAMFGYADISFLSLMFVQNLNCNVSDSFDIFRSTNLQHQTFLSP